jgi:hypothetical protein
MKRLTRPIAAATAAAALALLTPSAFAAAGPPANCSGQDASFLGSSLGAGFAQLVTDIAHTGTLGKFVVAEVNTPRDSCPF